MKILVSGGAGFIGSQLCQYLLSKECRVTAVDNFDPFYSPDIKRQNVRDHLQHQGFCLVEGSVTDEALWASLMSEDFDVIVHLAGRAGVRPSLADPIGYQNVNVAGTQYALEFARRKRIRQFVFASSSSVYGLNPRTPWDEADHDLRPISPYASTKLSCELLGHVYAHLYGIRFVGLRFFTVYGPRQRPDLAICRFARRILSGEPIMLYGDGSSARDYTYIDDIVSGIAAAMVYDGSAYEIFNLGNERCVRLCELIAVLEASLGKRAERVLCREQAGDVSLTWANIDKARSLLQYNPKTTIEDGVGKFVEWLQSDRADALAFWRGTEPPSNR